MDIKQDPNSIPNFNGGGRIGEAARSEPEQQQSSTVLDSTADGDGATTDELDPRERQGAAPADPSKTGPGAIDGLVGAP